MIPKNEMQSFVDNLPESSFSMEIDTPVGPLFLTGSEEGLHGIFFDPEKRGAENQKILEQIPRKQTALLKETKKQFKEYFQGKRKQFELPLVPAGTAFQQQAWKQLKKIPYGETVCYQEQAKKMRNPRAVRAVGSANGRNPLSIVVPCHRVISKSGGLGGFGGGLTAKRFLLDLETKYANS